MTVSRKYNFLSHFYDFIFWTYTKKTISSALAMADLKGKESVCDIGCGTGPLEMALIKRFPDLQITGCDISDGMIERAQRKIGETSRVTWKGGDFTSLPLPERHFDVLFSLSNLHYFPDLASVFLKAARIAAPGASLVMVDWCHGSWQSKFYQRCLRFVDPGFQKIYSLTDIRSLLKETGWRLDDVHYFSIRGYWTMMALRARKDEGHPW